MGKKNINLYLVYKKSLKNKSLTAGTLSGKTGYIVFALYISILVLIYFHLNIQINKLTAEYKNLESSVKITDVENAELNALKLENATDILEKISMQYEEQKININDSQLLYNRLPSDLMKKISSCVTSDLKIQSVKFNSGMLAIEAFADNISSISKFINNIENKNIFSNIIYNGYEISGEKYHFVFYAEFSKEDIDE